MSEVTMNDLKLLISIVEIQTGVQDHVMPSWRKSRISPIIAMRMELAEAIAQLGPTEVSEWWKKTPRNHNQYILELIDALVFFILETGKNGGPSHSVSVLIDGMASIDDDNYDDVIDENRVEIISDAMENWLSETGLVEIASNILFLLIEATGDMASVYKWYLGKSVLNKFRKSNGYKEGTYTKLWDGANEDNVYLAKVIEAVDIEVNIENRASIEDYIYKGLEIFYANLVKNK